MLKNRKKKGFTIVELVIVIAVIAILAAVLIPTFAGIIDLANKNSAMQAARNRYSEYLTSVDYTQEEAKTDFYIIESDYAFHVDADGRFLPEIVSATVDEALILQNDNTFVTKKITVDGTTLKVTLTDAVHVHTYVYENITNRTHDVRCTGCDEATVTGVIHTDADNVYRDATNPSYTSLYHYGDCVCGTAILVRHSFVYTEKDNSVHTVTCSANGCTFSREQEHTYENGVCVCGKQQPVTGIVVQGDPEFVDSTYGTAYKVTVTMSVGEIQTISFDPSIVAAADVATREWRVNSLSEPVIYGDYYGKVNFNVPTLTVTGNEAGEVTLITQSSDGKNIVITITVN